MSATDSEISLAMAQGSLNAIKAISDVVGEMQDIHDAAPLEGRYQLLLSNWVRLQLELVDAAADLMRQISDPSD